MIILNLSLFRFILLEILIFTTIFRIYHIYFDKMKEKNGLLIRGRFKRNNLIINMDDYLIYFSQIRKQ